MNSSSLFTLIFVLAYYIWAIWMVRGIKVTTKDICVASAVIAMTIVLEMIRIPLPTGATICLLSPVPLLLLAVLWDYKLAILSGWCCGILVIFFIPGWQIVHWGQFFVEHMICFSCLGFDGIFGYQPRYKLIGGLLLASGIKIIAHTLSGVMFFSQNAWSGWGAWGYSLVYNISQNVPLLALSALLILILPLTNIQHAIQGEAA